MEVFCTVNYAVKYVYVYIERDIYNCSILEWFNVLNLLDSVGIFLPDFKGAPRNNSNICCNAWATILPYVSKNICSSEGLSSYMT